jgi:hypothetical protein
MKTYDDLDEEEEVDEDEITPGQIKRFRNAIKALNKLMAEIKEKYPDANYYLQEDSMHLMIGKTHSDAPGEKAQRENSACAEWLPGSGGGAW